MQRIIFLAFVVLCMARGLASAANTPQSLLSLKKADNEVLLFLSKLQFIEDTTGTLSFEQVLQRQDLFSLRPSFGPQDYNPKATYWVKLQLNFQEAADKYWLLEFYDQTIDHIELYAPNDGGGYTKHILGDQHPFATKAFKHKNFIVALGSDLRGTYTYYFKISSHTYADIRIAVRTANRFVAYALNEYFLYGIFYGTILIISLYNLLMYLAIRERKYLFYTFYLLSVGIYAMAVDGIAYQYLWPAAPDWNQFAYGAALFSLIFWSILFGQRFLNTRARMPKLHSLLNLILGLRILLFIYALVWDRQLFELRSIEIIPLALIFSASIWVWVRGYKPARFFVMAYGFLFLGFLFKALVHLSVIPFGIVSYYSLHFCFLLEMLFLSFALSDRIRILKDLRDRVLKRALHQHQENALLKDKVNKELEERISKRTRELEEKNRLLEETNDKLYKQTNEIGRINSMLDLDNWKLKNNIKEILQDRIVNKNLSPEQFYRVFHNNDSCYRFLEKLKWKDGFSCSKCQHASYTNGQLPYARRCTRCGYDESVTSHTVFHRIKFPLEKAFFLLYLTTNSQKKYTLAELSEMLQLRRNTIWTFKKKLESSYNPAQHKDSGSAMHNFFLQENAMEEAL